MTDMKVDRWHWLRHRWGPWRDWEGIERWSADAIGKDMTWEREVGGQQRCCTICNCKQIRRVRYRA